MSQLRLLASGLFLLLVTCPPARANPQPIPGYSRQSLSLDGTWSLTGPGVDTTVQVPGTQPQRWAVMRWSRTFSLTMGSRPAHAWLEFGGIVNRASVTLNGVALGMLNAFTPAVFDVAAALVPSGTNVLEVAIDDRLTSVTAPGGPTFALFEYFGDDAYFMPIPWSNRPGIIRSVSLTWSSQPIVDNVFAEVTLNTTLTQADVRVRVRVRGLPSATQTAVAGLTLDGAWVGGCMTQDIANSELSALSPSPPPVCGPRIRLISTICGLGSTMGRRRATRHSTASGCGRSRCAATSFT